MAARLLRGGARAKSRCPSPSPAVHYDRGTAYNRHFAYNRPFAYIAYTACRGTARPAYIAFNQNRVQGTHIADTGTECRGTAYIAYNRTECRGTAYIAYTSTAYIAYTRTECRGTAYTRTAYTYTAYTRAA